MKNRFRKGEVVLVDGIGKISEKKHRQLGIIEAKEYFYNEYLITLISSKTEDWFREKDIKIVMERNFKKNFFVCTIFLFLNKKNAIIFM